MAPHSCHIVSVCNFPSWIQELSLPFPCVRACGFWIHVFLFLHLFLCFGGMHPLVTFKKECMRRWHFWNVCIAENIFLPHWYLINNLADLGIEFQGKIVFPQDWRDCTIIFYFQVIIPKSYAIQSSSFICGFSLLRSFFFCHQYIWHIPDVICVLFASYFMCMELSEPFQPEVPILVESGDGLVHESTKFFFKGLDSKYFRLCGPQSLLLLALLL